MGVYKKAVITEAGEVLAARAVSGEVTIQFSHAGTSSYAYSEGTNLKKLTELQDVKQTVIPSNVQIANDTLISIRSMFDNSGITQEYLIQNVGIYASDGETEILFAVCQAATPDQMPAFNGVAPSSFIYNVQISIAQAEQLSISISTAGAATVQDVLDLEKKMEEKKLDSSGGDASDTVASVEEPDSEEEKYPDIGSKGSMKNILGNLYRWVKNLKADKVDSAGGDTAETVVSEFEASFENFPVPAAKEKAKTRWGKVKKFGDDFKAWMTGVCLLGHIVNNCVTNNPNLPLSAAQGKALMDLYTVLNTKALKLYNYSNNADQVSADGYTGKTLEQYARFIRDNRGYRENFSFVTTPTLSTELPVEINATYVCRVNMIYIQGDDYRCQLIPLWSNNADTYYCSMNLYSDKISGWIKK